MTTTIYNPLPDSEKICALKDFAAAVVDNIGPELSAIEASGTQLLEATGLEANLRENVRTIIRNTRAAASAINYLSSITGRRPVQPRSLDVGDVLEGLRSIVGRLSGDTIALEISYATGVWPIEADIHALEAMILALSANARDAMPHGGKLTWAVKNVAVTTQDTAHGQGIPVGNYVAIEVTDTGCGIPADLIGRIFEPFFSTKSGRGNGTGLSIVYDAIIKMNGHILVESEVEKGTKFWMFVPPDAGSQSLSHPS